MKRFWAHLSAAVAVGLGLASSLPACAHNDKSLYVHGVLFPPAAVPVGQSCAYTPSPTTPFLAEGLFDVGLTDSYAPAILLGNQMVSKADSVQLRAESNRIQLQGAVSRVTDLDGTELASFTSLTSGTIQPANGIQPSYLQTFVTVVDPATTELLRTQLPSRKSSKTIIAYFTVFGEALGGQAVETGEFQFPIRVCNGCLVRFTTDATGTIDCTTPPSGPDANFPCKVGQEQSLACYYCADRPACEPPR